MMKVTLTELEILAAALCGILRTISARVIGLKPAKEWDWNLDIDGCLGLMAFCKAYGFRFPFSITKSKGPDVGCFSVRHTRVTNGRLIIRENDWGNRYYILVIGVGFEHTVIGGIYGSDAKRMKPEPDLDRKVAWCVPQESLIPVEDLDITRCLR